MSLKGKEILLGVTGGIACYKSLELVGLIRKMGGSVSVVMTRSAREFATPLSFQTLSNRRVFTDLFSLDDPKRVDHIAAAERADALLIAPATANSIAKFALGLADDLLSTMHLACEAPLVIAPAMNAKMWTHPTTCGNIALLKKRGAFVIPPESGPLACGSTGIGRMSEPETIAARLDGILSRPDPSAGKELPLKGVGVLVTSGPTREKIDAVRYLSNYSSGKMGFAVAEVCRELGAEVCLISGPTFLAAPKGIEPIRVDSAAEMHREVIGRSHRFPLVIKAAAVADYRVESPSEHKRKKKGSLALTLTENPDILKELGAQKTERQYLVGFAAESRDMIKHARFKLQEKNLDLVVANDILQSDAGFHADTNRVVLVDREREFEIPLMSKREVAFRIVRHILQDPNWLRISANL